MCITGEYVADMTYKPEDIISKHIQRLKALPHVTPIRPKGHWDIKDNMWWVCSACGCQTRMMKKYNVPNFCPACGAKMVEPQESEET
jgi:rubrerythrin